MKEPTDDFNNQAQQGTQQHKPLLACYVWFEKDQFGPTFVWQREKKLLWLEETDILKFSKMLTLLVTMVFIWSVQTGRKL